MNIRQNLLDQAIQQVKAKTGTVSFGDVQTALAQLQLPDGTPVHTKGV